MDGRSEGYLVHPRHMCSPRDGSDRQQSGRAPAGVGDSTEDVIIHVRTPPPLHVGAAPQTPPPSANHGATARCATLRPRWLSPTTELEVGAVHYGAAYPRLCSVEYVLAAATAVAITAYGFTVMWAFCDVNFSAYHIDVDVPYPTLFRLGSRGYDDVVDKQWTGFIIQFPRFLALATLLGGVTRLHHATVGAWRDQLPSPSTSSSPSTASDSNAAVLVSHSSVDALDSSQRKMTRPRRSAWTSVRQWRAHLRLLGSPSAARLACARFLDRAWIIPSFYAIVGVVFVVIVHGPHFFLPLLIIAANYVVFTRLQRWCPYWLFMAIMWITHVALLYIIEINGGFELTYWMQYYLPTNAAAARSVLGFSQQPLWRQYMRWYVAYRMTTLRLIAFNYDLWEATHAAARARERAAERHDTACVECAQLRERNNAAAAAALPAEASRCYKYRTEYTRDLADYSFVNYVAYVLFPPLYIAGPMSSFNAFVSHMRVPSTAMPLRAMARYAFGIARLYVTECILMHFVHLSALGKNTHLLLRMSVLEQAHFLLFMLAYLWIKFSFIWKSSRLFAMLSGIEVPEDMRRCFANTLTVRDFWRDWHASFNLWIVRYMYIPMGGRGRVALSVLPIFLFIAVWHDPALHLIKWALCIAVMFVAEMAVSACFGRAVAVFRREAAPAAGLHGDEAVVVSAGADAAACRAPRRGVVARLARVAARCLSPRVRSWLYRQIRVVAGMSTVFGLIVANLVGFSMQNAAATMAKRGTTLEPTDAEDVIARAFRKFTPWFTCGLVAIIYAGSALAVMDRDMAHHQEVWLKRFYGLKV